MPHLTPGTRGWMGTDFEGIVGLYKHMQSMCYLIKSVVQVSNLMFEGPEVQLGIIFYFFGAIFFLVLNLYLLFFNFISTFYVLNLLS